MFKLAILDESHRLISRASRTFNCCVLHDFPRVLAVSATPLHSRPANALPMLTLFRQAFTGQRLLKYEQVDDPPYVDDFEDLNKMLLVRPGYLINERDDKKLLKQLRHCLDIPTIAKIVAVVNKPLEITQVLSGLLRLFLLRQTAGRKFDHFGQETMVGEGIPRGRIGFVELMATDLERKVLDPLHETMCSQSDYFVLPPDQSAQSIAVEEMNPDIKADAKKFQIDMDKRRRLNLGCFASYLDNMYKLGWETGAKHIAGMFNDTHDAGFARLFRLTHAGEVPAPTERVTQLQYLLVTSSKLMFLYQLVRQSKGAKHIVFTYWPPEMLLLATMFTLMGVRVGWLRTGMSAKERATIQADFNSKEEGTIQILLLSARGNAESLNLQGACSRVVFMTILAFMEFLQGHGRVERIGQKEVCRTWILSLDLTYDQVLVSRYSVRALATYATFLGMEPLGPEQYDVYRKQPGIEQRLEAWMEKGEMNEDEAISRMYYVDRASAALVATFGLRSPRHLEVWRQEASLEARLNIPAEREFYRQFYPESVERFENAVAIAARKKQQVDMNGRTGEQRQAAASAGSSSSAPKPKPATPVKKSKVDRMVKAINHQISDVMRNQRANTPEVADSEDGPQTPGGSESLASESFHGSPAVPLPVGLGKRRLRSDDKPNAEEPPNKKQQSSKGKSKED